MATNFINKKIEFDSLYGGASTYTCFLPEHLTVSKVTCFRNSRGGKNEQYYKWQFLYALVNSGMFSKDLIGTEIHFPKGNKSSAPIKLDAAVFDDPDWWNKYNDYHSTGNVESLDWLRKHLILVFESKKEDGKSIQETWDKQLKAYLKESERKYCVGVLYDTERLFLFRKFNGVFVRFSDAYNTKGDASTSKDMSLHLPDPYSNIPSFDQILRRTKSRGPKMGSRGIKDLNKISGVQSVQINDAMSAILRTMDKQGMVNQKGFEILIQILSLKIYDEKRNESSPRRHLDFYVTDAERNYRDLSDANIQGFITRIESLRNEAKGKYIRILSSNLINFKDINHIKILVEVVYQFQDYSFVLSQKTDLYQLVFYKFAGQFSKDEHAQFITPLPLIDFLVNIVNPRNGETVIDPTVGIADFLSVSYVNSDSKLDDNNIFGIDIDSQMVMLATLNMLLNGDGNAKIEAIPGYGSLYSKFDISGGVIDLIPSMNKGGNWDNRPDTKSLKKFDVVLTNPPFGDDRAFVPKNQMDLDVVNCYELWQLYGTKTTTTTKSGTKTKKVDVSKIDQGVLFLENAYRSLADNGRLGIVLSNSIASIDAHQIARRWLMDKMRIVAIFDLPANVFAETGVNTTIIVAYKPLDTELQRLKSQNYEIFSRTIKKVGYEVRTIKRVKHFEPLYRMDYDTFNVVIDADGNPLLDEDFTKTVSDFREWCKGQESTLKKLFISKK